MGGQPSTCSACPLYGKGTGFVLGSGDPTTAKMGLLLEAPGREELIWPVGDDEELHRRIVAYKGTPMEFLRKGMPVVGKSGGILFGWGLAPVQLTRRDLFIDNVLRCLPPKVKENQYPTGDERKAAEAHCRQYDRWDQFQPTVALVNIHPAAIAREPSPLPLMIKTFEKGKHFAVGGERPLVLCGGKAVGMWLGYGSTVQTWLGHYATETELLASQRERRREAGMAIKVGPKVPKVKKLTARTALALLVKDAQPVIDGDGNITEHVISEVRLSDDQFRQVLSLIAGKAKKEKVK